MQMHTDNPTRTSAEDRFGFAPYADLLADTIRDTARLPFCIGIYGPWGTGKTSLMLMIEENMKAGRANAKTIWFNPWKYDKKEDLWGALIRTILFQIKEEGNQQAKDKADQLVREAAWLHMQKKGITPTTMGRLTDEDLANAKAVAMKEDESQHRYVNHFEKDFADAVTEYTGVGGKLVVFVDDLDRCLPENAITVLESLKLFIGESNCVFVLGMDHGVVEAGIVQRYGRHVKMSGRDYLDKIVQVPFYLPPVPFDRLRAALREEDNAGEADEDADKLWSLIATGLGGNPRKTKRFVNCFALLRRIIDRPDMPEFNLPDANAAVAAGVPVLTKPQQEYYLAEILIIQMQFPRLYQYLLLENNALRALEHVAHPEQGANQAVLNDNPDLKRIWDDDANLRSFVSTAMGEHAPYTAPGAEVTAMLLRMVNLVSKTEGLDTPSIRPGGIESRGGETAKRKSATKPVRRK